MGEISKKLKAEFARWGGRLRQQMERESIPKDVHDMQALVAEGHDPLHAVYIFVQNLTSLFAECVSVLPKLLPYYDIVAAAEDNYLPGGPPMSPLTRSYFTGWAFFDLRFGDDLETIGSCLLEVSNRLGIDADMKKAIRQYQESRMGIYEHCGMTGGRIHLRELVTDRDFSCFSASGYQGRPGELWYVRLCPPLFDLADYHVTVTTPYILTGSTKTDWSAYLERAMLRGKGDGDEEQRLHDLLKYGLSVHHWNEYVFLGFHHAQFDAIFLTGIPDVKGSLPHVKKRK